MSAGTADVSRPRAAHGHVTQVRVLVSEWVKLRTVRSTFFTLVAAAIAMTGLGPLFSEITADRWPDLTAAERAAHEPVALSLVGYYLAQLAVCVLGVLVITGEYSTGMIRATLSAVPRRLPVLWAKAAVYGAVVFSLMAASSVTAFLISQNLLEPTGIATSLGEAGVTRVVLGNALYLTVLGLLSVGVGALVRNTAGGTTIIFGVLLVVPEIVKILPANWADTIGKYLPNTAGRSVAVLDPGPSAPAPWTGFAVLCLYAAVALGAAALTLKQRDA
ncbi:ABC-2 family transporter protein [Streptomyces sp. WMMB 714]|uniref:ABC transporter permease n=1 Tax=Streptomyces sp. WMMB 714 TaxID=1286822 RepID=UPI0005F88F10|nr:ABC transporter permease [Streptomyces sp. WMMB 714]SCK09878.1 ABC-2 family transporter protein [Streptomyces sp. WMMB 714]